MCLSSGSFPRPLASIPGWDCSVRRLWGPLFCEWLWRVSKPCRKPLPHFIVRGFGTCPFREEDGNSLPSFLGEGWLSPQIRVHQQERRSKWSVLEMVLGFIIFPLVAKLLHFLVFYYIQNYVFFTFLEKTQYLSKRERETSYHWLNHIPNAHVGRDWS